MPQSKSQQNFHDMPCQSSMHVNACQISHCPEACILRHVLRHSICRKYEPQIIGTKHMQRHAKQRNGTPTDSKLILRLIMTQGDASRHASIGIQIAAPKTTQQKRNGQKRYERRRMIQDAMNQKKSASIPDQTKYPPTSVFSAITTLLTLKRMD